MLNCIAIYIMPPMQPASSKISDMSASLYKKQFSRNCAHCNYKVILLGDYGVGKTSLFRRIKEGKQPQSLDSITSSSLRASQDTIDHCVRTFTMDSGKKVQIDFWDTGGAERFRGSLTNNYYKSSTGVVLVYDAADPATLTSLRNWIEDVETYTNGVTFLLLGNKYDGSDLIDDGLADAFALHNEIKLHFKISSHHIDDATLTHIFQTMAEHMHRKMEHNFNNMTLPRTEFSCTCNLGQDTVTLLANSSNKSSCCLKR